MPKTSLDKLFYGAVTVGERGQIVIPAEARKDCGLAAGDKLLVFGQPHGRGLMIARVDDLQQLVAEIQRGVLAAVETEVSK